MGTRGASETRPRTYHRLLSPIPQRRRSAQEDIKSGGHNANKTFPSSSSSPSQTNITTMNSFVDKYKLPLSFTHDTTHDDAIATTPYIPIPYDHHQTLEDAVQVPSAFLYNTYSPSDNDDLWASM